MIHLFGHFKKRNRNTVKKETVPYSDFNKDMLLDTISVYYGQCSEVLYESVSEIIQVDIGVIEPSKSKDYYTLVSLGVGAKAMHSKQAKQHVELVIHLPKYWDIHSDDEQWHWPIRLLKTIARYPFLNDTQIRSGDILEFGDGFFDRLNYYGVVLSATLSKDGTLPQAQMDGGQSIDFLQVIPLFKEEIAFSKQSSSESLLESLEAVKGDYVINTDRKSTINTQ